MLRGDTGTHRRTPVLCGEIPRRSVQGRKTILNDGTIGFDPVDINFFSSYPELLDLKTGNFAVSWEIESELHAVEFAERYGDNHQVRWALKAICLRLGDFLERLGDVSRESR